jgi:hypothetical protein
MLPGKFLKDSVYQNPDLSGVAYIIVASPWPRGSPGDAQKAAIGNESLAATFVMPGHSGLPAQTT